MDPGDLVLDPFGGSNVTGAAAEATGRQWISCELDPAYVKASRFRFEHRPAVSERAIPRLRKPAHPDEFPESNPASKEAWLF